MEQTKKQELLSKSAYTVDDLRTIMCLLRSEDGCPWDREQTHKSIRNSFLEEAYEAVEGIDKGDDAILKEELGDVLLHVVFHARIAEEEGVFDLDDVADGICKKLIYRHPHVFAGAQADSAAAALDGWEAIKEKERAQRTLSEAMAGVTGALPSLWRAEKIQSKAQRAGRQMPSAEEAAARIRELADEVARSGEPYGPMGELLYAVVALARARGVDGEMALHSECEHTIARERQREEAEA